MSRLTTNAALNTTAPCLWPSGFCFCFAVGCTNCLLQPRTRLALLCWSTFRLREWLTQPAQPRNFQSCSNEDATRLFQHLWATLCSADERRHERPHQLGWAWILAPESVKVFMLIATEWGQLWMLSVSARIHPWFPEDSLNMMVHMTQRVSRFCNFTRTRVSTQKLLRWSCHTVFERDDDRSLRQKVHDGHKRNTFNRTCWRPSSKCHCAWARGFFLCLCFCVWADFCFCRFCFFLCSCPSLLAPMSMSAWWLNSSSARSSRLKGSLSYSLCPNLRNATEDVLAAVAAPPQSVSPCSGPRPALRQRSARTRGTTFCDSDSLVNVRYVGTSTDEIRVTWFVQQLPSACFCTWSCIGHQVFRRASRPSRLSVYMIRRRRVCSWCRWDVLICLLRLVGVGHQVWRCSSCHVFCNFSEAWVNCSEVRNKLNSPFVVFFLLHCHRSTMNDSSVEDPR